MKLTANADKDYTAIFTGSKMQFFIKGQLQATLEVRTIKQARDTLNAWARLKVSISDVMNFQKVSEKYVGCTVDDVAYTSDGKSYTVLGKPVEKI